MEPTTWDDCCDQCEDALELDSPRMEEERILCGRCSDMAEPWATIAAVVLIEGDL